MRSGWGTATPWFTDPPNSPSTARVGVRPFTGCGHRGHPRSQHGREARRQLHVAELPRGHTGSAPSSVGGGQGLEPGVSSGALNYTKLRKGSPSSLTCSD